VTDGERKKTRRAADDGRRDGGDAQYGNARSRREAEERAEAEASGLEIVRTQEASERHRAEVKARASREGQRSGEAVHGLDSQEAPPIG